MSVQTRDLNWLELVQKAEGKNWTEPEDAYQFTGRTFKDRGRAFEAPPIVSIGASLYADNYADDYYA